MSTNLNQLHPEGNSVKDEEILLAEQLYDEIIESVCIDVATGIMRLAKTGQISISDAAVNPNPYENQSGEKLESGGDGISAKRRKTGSGIANEDTMNINGKSQDTEMRLRTRGTTSGIDAWGRIPPKDVLTVCKVCSKNMSATRFAAHLHKCLGIGTSRASNSRSTKSL